MANRLKMATVDSILRLHAQGRSQRQIAIDLHVDRKAVSRYVQLSKRDAASATAPSGVSGPDPVGALLPPPPVSKGTNAPTGSVADSLPPAVAEFLARPSGRGRRSDGWLTPRCWRCRGRSRWGWSTLGDGRWLGPSDPGGRRGTLHTCGR